MAPDLVSFIFRGYKIKHEIQQPQTRNTTAISQLFINYMKILDKIIWHGFRYKHN